MNNQVKNNRTISLDIARAITIILVVIGHYMPDNSPNWYAVLHRFIYSFHMPLFLFISGFIYMQTLKKESYLTFVTRKVKRLMIPYFTTSFLVITIKLLSSSNASLENPVTPFSYIEMFYSPAAGFFLWFIWVLFIIFLIIPFFRTFKAICILSLISIVLYFLPINLPQYFCLAEFKSYFLYFMFGVLFFHLPKAKQICKNVSLYIYFALLLGLFILMELSSYFNITVILTALVGTAAVCKLSIIITKHANKSKALFINISAASYIIYLLHTTFEGFGKAIVPKVIAFSNFNISFIICAVLIVMIGIIGPYLAYVLIQHNKILCFLFGLKFSRKA